MKTMLNILIILLMFFPGTAISDSEVIREKWSQPHQRAWEAIDQKNIEAFQQIFKQIKNPYLLHKKYKDTLLAHAVTKGADQIAIYMLDQGTNPNDDSKQLPLNNAVSRFSWYKDKMLPVIKRLIKSKADVNAQGKLWGKTPLHHAKMADYEVVKILLESGADPNLQDKKRQTALHVFAGHSGEIRTIQLLVDHGADASITDIDHNTPLHKMIGHWLGEDSVQVAQLLIAAGADPKFKNNDGKTALDLLNSRANPDLFSKLKEKLENVTQ